MPSAFVLIDDGFQDAEVVYPMYRLREAGFDTQLVGPKAGQRVVGKYGYPVTADTSVNDARLDNVDVLVIPGGWAPDHMRVNPAFVNLVQDAMRRGVVVAAICHAGQLLVEADVVSGRTVTSYVAVRRDLQNAGATWLDQSAVVDGNLVTSRTPDDLPAFLAATLQLVADRAVLTA